MLADTRLRLREAVRRNGDGSLWRPRWWPSDLAPLFWPLLLALALTLVVALGLGLERLKPAPLPAPPVDAPAAQPESIPEPSPALTQVPEPEPQPQPPVEAIADPDPEISAEPAPVPEPPPPDPLVLLLQRPGADGLIRVATGQVEASTLVLQLAPAFPALAPKDQLRRAELWQQWGRDLGYDHLELRDSRAGLLGRDALVGNGMILFNSEPRT